MNVQPTQDSIPLSPLDRATAVIIGRAGSKGLPGKNSVILHGKPIVAYSIEQAALSKWVDQVVVSTDCKALANAASEYLDCEVVERPAELASDHATVDAAVRQAIEYTQDTSPIVVILYANVPIRPANLIDRAIDKLHQTGADSVQSYAPVGKYHPYWESSIDDNGCVKAYFENTVYRRQDLPELFIPDGGVIAVRRDSLFQVVEGQPHAFLGTDRRGIENPHGAVVDIDSPFDLVVAETVLATSGTSARITPTPQGV